MTTTANAIEDDNRGIGLGERIIAALEDAGVDTDALTPEILAPADQIHGGGPRPGGVFAFTEPCRGPGGAPDYPLRWARDPSHSFLVTPEAPGTLLEDAEFRITRWLDTSRSRVAADRKRLDSAAPKAQPAGPLSVYLVRGEDYRERQANSSKGVIDGRLINLTVVTERADQ